MNLRLYISALILCCCLPSAAQGLRALPASTQQSTGAEGYDVFIPISKYIAQGNSDALSAWFADNLEISILSKGVDASKAQARQMAKSFFNSYTPRSLNIVHTAGKANMKYALCELIAGGETFRVTIFVSCKKDKFKIQQLKIERM